MNQASSINNLRDEAPSKNSLMASGNGRGLDDDTHNEGRSRNQHAVFSGQNLGDETRENSTQPGTQLEDGGEPPLLCRDLRIAVHV